MGGILLRHMTPSACAKLCLRRAQPDATLPGGVEYCVVNSEHVKQQCNFLVPLLSTPNANG